MLDAKMLVRSIDYPSRIMPIVLNGIMIQVMNMELEVLRDQQ